MKRCGLRRYHGNIRSLRGLVFRGFGGCGQASLLCGFRLSGKTFFVARR